MSLRTGSNDLVLAIDQGTTNTKGLLVSRSGALVFSVSSPLTLLYARPDRIEQSPDAIWASVLDVASRCVEHIAGTDSRVQGLAISNQRETAVAWHRQTGEPLGNAISWQCRRSAAICRQLAPHTELIRRKAGLPLDPLLTASKWRWMLEDAEFGAKLCDLERVGNLCLGTVDSWLIYKLTGGAIHATDHSNASRTALLNLENLQWDDELLALFNVPGSALPEILPSAGQFGRSTAIAGLAGVPIVAALGDSHAALAAHGCAGAGAVKATYGTGSSLMMLSDGLPADTGALARTVAWSTLSETLYALEGNIAMTGSAVQWVGEFLGLEHPVDDAIALAASVGDAAGLIFVPAMAGLGAPHWDAEARGTVCGLGRSHTAAHLARAAVDAIAHQVADVFEAIERAAGYKLLELHADGGATRNGTLIQFQADILNRDVLRSTVEELSAIGAAWLGGTALGWWRSIAEPGETAPPSERIRPAMAAPERERLRSGWRNAVQRTLTRANAGDFANFEEIR